MESLATLGGPGAAVLARTLSMRSAPDPTTCIVRRFSASPERVFDAWWNGEDFRFAGEYLEISRPQRLAFTWITPWGSPNGARVAIDVRPLASGCELSLTSDANRTETTAWQGMVHALSEMLG